MVYNIWHETLLDRAVLLQNQTEVRETDFGRIYSEVFRRKIGILSTAIFEIPGYKRSDVNPTLYGNLSGTVLLKKHLFNWRSTERLSSRNIVKKSSKEGKTLAANWRDAPLHKAFRWNSALVSCENAIVLFSRHVHVCFLSRFVFTNSSTTNTCRSTLIRTYSSFYGYNVNTHISHHFDDVRKIRLNLFFYKQRTTCRWSRNTVISLSFWEVELFSFELYSRLYFTISLNCCCLNITMDQRVQWSA